MTIIRYYSAVWCSPCSTEYPKVVKAANKLGFKVERIDIDRCPINLEKKCGQIEFVPTIELNGKLMSVPELQEIANSIS